MIPVEGKYGIKATTLAHSISESGVEMSTYEIEYPRLVLAELNTHRMLSKNSFSSRAVPFLKMIEQLNGRPVRFGANQAGMQDKGEDFIAPICVQTEDYCGENYGNPEEAWDAAKYYASAHARAFFEAGYHKQVYNRLLEPWQMMKTVISGTEWANFFWLRDHGAADPTLAELARVMREAKEQSTPTVLKAGEWHLPYIDAHRDSNGVLNYYIVVENDGLKNYVEELTLEEAIKVSCARCAAVSYRNEGYGLEKSLEVYDRLVGDDRKHASAFEHCATPMKGCHNGYYKRENVNVPSDTGSWEEGITHMDRKGNLWSGNLKGWIQYRKLIAGENYTGE